MIAADVLQAVGYTAGLLTSLAYVPQVLRLWRTRSAEDISLPTFCLLSVGIGLWLLYGIGIRSGPVIAANGLGVLLTLCIVVMKLRYRRRSGPRWRR